MRLPSQQQHDEGHQRAVGAAPRGAASHEGLRSGTGPLPALRAAEAGRAPRPSGLPTARPARCRPPLLLPGRCQERLGAGSRAGQSRAGQRRSAGSAAGAMGPEAPWLNHSGGPRAGGDGCAGGGQRPGPFNAAAAALLAALMGLLVLATVLGNALVILAFVVDRSLRSHGNFFFLNLAIADLLVGECRGRREGAGVALRVSPPSSVRRRLLHPPLHPLRADGRVEARPGLVQAVAGGGLPGVHCLGLQHRPDQLRQIHLRHQGGKGWAGCPELQRAGGGAGSPQHRAWSSCRDWGGLQGLHGCPIKQEGGLGSASSPPAEPQPPQERGAVQTQPTACRREHLGQDGQVLLPFTRVRIPPLSVSKIVLYAAGEARRAEGALFTYFILSPTLVKVKKAVPS